MDNESKKTLQKIIKAQLLKNPLFSSLAGGFGSSIATLLTYPLSTICLRLQIQQQNETEKVSGLTITQKIYEQEGGFFAFYRGLKTAIFANALQYSIFYYFYQTFDNKIYRFGKKLGYSSDTLNLLISALAGTCCAMFTNGFWLISNRQAASKSSKNNSFLEKFSSLLKKEGPLGFFKGLAPNLILVVNPVLVYFFAKKMENLLLRYKKNLGPKEQFFIGVYGKFIATILTYPIQIAKSRQQTDETERSMIEILKNIFEKENFVGLYKGVTTKLFQTLTLNGFLFSSKTFLDNFFGDIASFFTVAWIDFNMRQ